MINFWFYRSAEFYLKTITTDYDRFKSHVKLNLVGGSNF